MAKYITLSPEQIQEYAHKIAQEVVQALANKRSTQAITYKIDTNRIKLDNPIILDFSGIAYLKMMQLVQTQTSEIAWHGLVETTEDRKCFRVTDILVYPQTVTSTNVVTDETKYQLWKNALPDEQYNKLRFQGHSHVNMTATPSSVDIALYDKMLESLGNNSFYIFLIANKSSQFWVNIYDIENNLAYDKEDIKITVEGIEIASWCTAQVNAFLEKPTYNYTTTAKAQSSISKEKEDEKKTKRSGGKSKTTTVKSRTATRPGKATDTGPYEECLKCLNMYDPHNVECAACDSFYNTYRR